MSAAQHIGAISGGQGLSLLTEPRLNILQRIANVMRDVRGVSKKSENTHAHYKYAGHEAVTEALRDAFVKHGIVRKASVTSCTVEHGVVTLLVEVSHISVDDRSDCVVSVMPAIQPPQTTAGKVTAQQVGQAVSYAVKNVEFKLFALTGDDTPDSDGNDPEITYREEYQPRETTRVQRAPQNDGAQALAVEYLARFEECRTIDEVNAHNKEVEKNWVKVKGIEGFSDHFVAARRKARNRVLAGQ